VLDDVSCQGSPQTWAVAAVKAYHDHGANVIVAEANQGGAMVKHTIHTIDPTIPVVLVWASHAKEARAEPISSLYEQEKMHHMGVFAELEDQMCEWEPGHEEPRPPGRAGVGIHASVPGQVGGRRLLQLLTWEGILATRPRAPGHPRPT
jgi:phage terminase large subunit-like protein